MFTLSQGCNEMCFVLSGENCNRGAALGALLGARGAFIGSVVPQKWKDGLKNAQKPISVILNDLP